VRLRRDDDHLLLTVKSGPGMVRTEEELELDQRRFEALWALTDGRQVTKIRHLVDGPDGTTIEVDVFEGALTGLVTAEVEFPSEEQSAAFAAPHWLGTEVTGDSRFANQRLAVATRPPAV
jgi:adenylate cyclase